MLKKYKFGFDMWGLLLLLIIMAPNFIWFAVPAINDVLRADSVTPAIDMIGNVLQVIMIAALCCIKYCGEKKIKMLPYLVVVGICIICYFVGWLMYYTGNASAVVILILTVSPCLAFGLFSIAKHNIFAGVAATGFTICHIIYAAVNFL